MEVFVKVVALKWIIFLEIGNKVSFLTNKESHEKTIELPKIEKSLVLVLFEFRVGMELRKIKAQGCISALFYRAHRGLLGSTNGLTSLSPRAYYLLEIELAGDNCDSLELLGLIVGFNNTQKKRLFKGYIRGVLKAHRDIPRVYLLGLKRTFLGRPFRPC